MYAFRQRSSEAVDIDPAAAHRVGDCRRCGLSPIRPIALRINRCLMGKVRVWPNAGPGFKGYLPQGSRKREKKLRGFS